MLKPARYKAFLLIIVLSLYIALLVTLDWFLDRSRTAINVMGDMTVLT